MAERTDNQIVEDMERALLNKPLRKTVRFVDHVRSIDGRVIDVIPGDIYEYNTVEEVEPE
jgi:hypothetical protein